jgi:hypothetical protein
VNNPGGSLEVCSIDFEGPTTAIYCAAALDSATIKQNNIDISNTAPFYGVHIISETATIQLNTIDITNVAGATVAAIWLDQTGLAPGESTISDNQVTVYNSDGIKCQYVENLVVSENTIDIDSDGSYGTFEAILVRGSNSEIMHNKIVGPGEIRPGTTTLIAIAAANGNENIITRNKGCGFLTEGIRLHGVSDSEVSHNKFTGTLGVALWTYGAWMVPDGCDNNLIEKNKFDNVIGLPHGGSFWIGLLPWSYGMLLCGSNNLVQNNKISGEADYGVILYSPEPHPMTPFTTAHNTLRGNNLATLDCATATYWCMFDTHDNTVIGYTGTIIDDGTDNTFTGN